MTAQFDSFRSFLASFCLPPLAALACASAARLPAQQLGSGFSSTVHSLPSGAGNVLVLPGDQYVYFDGFDLWLEAPHQPPRTLLSFPNYTFGSFTLDVGNQQVLFGESSAQTLWLVSTAPSGVPSPVATVTFSYDAVVFAAGEVLVSAKTGGWGSSLNEVIHVDLSTGNTRLLAQLPGASGPIAIGASGDLFYATASMQFPAPPGAVTLLRFPRALVDQALANAQVLGIGQAQVVLAGLDAAGAMVCDDLGDLVFTDWYNDTVGVVHDVHGPAPWRTNLMDHTGAAVGATGVQFEAGPGYGVLAPFQPENGALYVRESAWGSASQVRRVVAARPALAVSGANPLPSGPFALDVLQGPANALGLIAVAFTSSAPAPIAVGGYQMPLWWELPGSALAAWFVPFDATGHAQLVLQNPGAQPALTIAAQAAFLDASLGVVGSTAARVLQLGP